MTGLSVVATTREITAGALPNPKDEIRAIVRALNKTAQQARTGTSRAVKAAGYNIKASAIKRSFMIDKAKPGKLAVTLRATGRPITLINYGATQTKKGVTMRVKSGRKLLKHAFIATMPNGHKGVFERVGTGHKRVTKKGRSYMSGLPIRELYGPSIPDSLANDAVQKALANLIADKYPAILEHEIAWLAAKRYGLADSHRIEHTRRDRKRATEPLVMPPDTYTDWTSERHKRAEVSRYGLPPFFTPTYEELRRIWKEHRSEVVRRLALEVQTGRHELYELLALAAEEHWHIDKEHATVEDARKAIGRIRRRLHQVKPRIGPLRGDDGRE